MKRQAYRLIASRLGLALLTLLIVSAIVFAMTGLLPGDAAQEALGQAATPAAVAALRHQFGLDQPALQRYLQPPIQVCVIGADERARKLEDAALRGFAVNKSVVRLARFFDFPSGESTR